MATPKDLEIANCKANPDFAIEGVEEVDLEIAYSKADSVIGAMEEVDMETTYCKANPDSAIKGVEEVDLMIAYCQANPDLAIGVVEGVVMMVPYNTEESSQQWKLIKSEKIHKCEQSYYLVNNCTKKALTAGPGTLASYVSARNFEGSDIKSDNMSWVPAKDIHDSYGSITTIKNQSLNVTVAGNVEEGSRLVLVPWGNANNQKWKFMRIK